jgi:hypothetical protein
LNSHKFAAKQGDADSGIPFLTILVFMREDPAPNITLGAQALPGSLNSHKFAANRGMPILASPFLTEKHSCAKIQRQISALGAPAPKP